MYIEIYIWCNNVSTYSYQIWKEERKTPKKSNNQIIFNHLFKQYRKNFKCTTRQLTTLTKKAKTMNEGETTYFTI